MEDEPSFEIPRHPERRYSRHAGLEYEGSTVFSLSPTADYADPELDDLLHSVLDDDRYTYGDWFDLPMALYLVYDMRTGDVFRVAVRGGTIELHVLPETDSAGLRALYRRLRERSECEWVVECRTDG